MGRTVRTFRNALDIEESRWKEFRRTLRPSQRDLVDRVFDYARAHADAGTMIVKPRIMEVVLLTALMEMVREIDLLQRRIKELEASLRDGDEDVG